MRIFRPRDSTRLVPYLLLLPAIALLATVLLLPLVQAVGYSFHSFDVTRPAAKRWIGLENYRLAFKDPAFLNSVVVTGLYLVGTVIPQLAFGLLLALLADSFGSKRHWIMSVLLIPMIIPPVVAGILWRMLYNHEYGILNYLLSVLGANPVNWLGDYGTTLYAVMGVEVWQNTPFVVLVLGSALLSLPSEPYEAARIDGCNKWKSFVYVTLPLLRPAILMSTLIRAMASLRVFDHVYTLTQGGPGNTTDVLSFLVYRTAFRYWDTGYSSALALLLVALSAGLCIIFVRGMRLSEV